MLDIIFFCTPRGNEPVKKWLEKRKNFTAHEQQAIAADINAVRKDWELCLNKKLVKNLERGLWEIRSHLGNRIVRIFFTRSDNLMVLLHGFVKKDQKIPAKELNLARRRRDAWHKAQ